MKQVTRLALTVVAVAMLMAFTGTSTASANTVVCKVLGTGTPTGTTCPEGQAYQAGSRYKWLLKAGVKLLISTVFKNIECEESTIEGEAGGETTPLISASVLANGKCNCSVSTLAKGKFEIHHTSGTHNGTLTSTGMELTVECSTIFGNVHCIYATSATNLGTLIGGNPGLLQITKVNIPRLATNALCAEKAEMSAEYETALPKPMFITEET